ncbi:MAG: protein translocase subunit SecD [Legionellales bacterium]|nr:protein translocase subunit SecD [Legionellales bacterium]
MLNKFPLWKYISLLAIVILAFIYALPNIYGELPAVQITGNAPGVTVSPSLQQKLEKLLSDAGIVYSHQELNNKFIQFSFNETTAQLKARDAIKKNLGDDYTTALSLAPATPTWLQLVGAYPMKYGLDLRGGVHFLLDVDANSVIKQRIHGDVRNMGEQLRDKRIRYAGIKQINDSTIQLRFRSQDELDSAFSFLHARYPEFSMIKNTDNNQFNLIATMTLDAQNTARQYVIEQTMTTLRNRVDELGVSNAVVQQQGANRVSVDLPGVLDAGRAKQILGGTATLEFRLVDENDNPANYIHSTPPVGTELFYMQDGVTPILLKKEIVLHGASITSAMASFGQDGQPNVAIRLGGGGEALFNRITRDNIGKRLAIVYVETKTEKNTVDGKTILTHKKIQRVISAPVIQSALGDDFQITGISDPREAQNLALLLRAGALPATIDIAQERTVGATLGKENINRGLFSIVLGFVLISIFMMVYYRLLGIFAVIALFMNLIITVAILSILGAVLTLPGIAGIVLTVGMAVDANVLIFERIREEIRSGLSPQAVIHAGYSRAFATIVDSNLTTLIAAFALFGIGTGPIKGFAISLSVGLLTSMFSAITGTRALVNLAYGGRNVKKLSVGI